MYNYRKEAVIALNEQYEAIYRKYYNRIFLFLNKLCGDRTLAEDLTQETFYQTFLSVDRFRGESDIYTFIAAIAKYTYLKYLRKNKHYANTVSLTDLEEMLCDSEECSPCFVFEYEYEQANIRSLLEKLPDKYRDVIMYRIYADMSYAQTAQAMGITENSAKVLFFRAKKRLLEDLQNGDYL